MIASVAEIKRLLQIDNKDSDKLIEDLIPILQDEVCAYTNNRFLRYSVYVEGDTISFATESGLGKIKDSNSLFVTNLFTAKDVYVKGSLYNDGYYKVDAVAAGELTLSKGDTVETEAAGAVITVYQVIFPTRLKRVFAELVAYAIERKGKLVNQESLPAGYSVTYKTEPEIFSRFNFARKPYR